MERSEAVLIIRELAGSLAAQPNQFNINVHAKAVGQSFQVSGGTGMVVSVTGGGPGSSVIGNQVRVGSADIKIAYEAADTAMTQQIQGLIDSLSELAKQLESEKPDEGLIHKIISSLKDSWVPPLITTVVNIVAGLALA